MSALGVVQRIGRVLLAQWPMLLLCAFACWLIWPAPIGKMPLSQDHTVHVARAWMVGEELKGGHLSGWSSYWYFGFPVGELYPVLGDLFVALLRALSFGLLSWPRCYAFVFTAAYLLQGIAMLRISRATGLGVFPGFVGAVLLYLDPGVLREGGWAYTVHFGVWMQPVACVFIWWAFADLAIAVRTPLRSRALVGPVVLVALAMLAHPIALPMAALGTIVMVVALGFRGEMARVLVACGIATAMGAALAAWWVLPMMSHSAWIANLGTLYSDVDTMVGRVWQGVWAKHMAPAIGYGIIVGLGFALVRGNRFTRGLAVLAVLLWLMSTSDFFFRFRLDWLSENFRYLQYQRFIICAKPGLYLAAGLVPAALFRLAWERWRAEGPPLRTQVVASAAAIAAILMLGAMLTGAAKAAKKQHVGELATQRVKGDKKLDKDFAAFNKWAKQQWEGRAEGEYFRFAYKTKRHSHIYADAPVFNGAPAYKIGYMPGEVFVHRPESEQSSVLDRLRVKYFVGNSTPSGARIVQRFGKLKVSQREVKEGIARVVGGGHLQVLVDDVDRERVSVALSGTKEGTRLEFNVAGFPRWEVLHDGVPVEWYEVPASGRGEHATPEQRRAGLFRAGKGNTTPPTDPMLLAVDATDGVYELRWRRWLPADIIGFAALAVAALVIGVLALAQRPAESVIARVERWLPSRVRLVLAALFVTAVLARYAAGFAAERHLASGWLRVGKADDAHGVVIGPVKIDRVIGPAIIAQATADDPATIVLPGVVPPDGIVEGWFGIDDVALKDAAAGWELAFEGRPSGTEDWIELRVHPVRVRSGRQEIRIDTRTLGDAGAVDLRVTVRGRAGDAPRVGFDLDLAAP